MFLSSGELMLCLVEGAFAEHAVDDIAASSGEGDEGVVVAFALGAGLQT